MNGKNQKIGKTETTTVCNPFVVICVWATFFYLIYNIYILYIFIQV